jgi:polyhydroxyalkanoate synthesis regulator protein
MPMIKKYPNRRLYCTENAGYITLEELAGRIRMGQKPVVRYQKDGTDATADVYAALIVDLAAKGKIKAAALLELIRQGLAPTQSAGAAAVGPQAGV